MRVLGSGDHDPVGLGKLGPQLLDGRGRLHLVVEIGVEVRQLGKAGVEAELHALARKAGGGTEESAIRGRGSKAS
jgi:hypothetical protein